MQNIDLFCIMLNFLNFKELISLRCVCIVLQELTYNSIIQNHVLYTCNRKMAQILFQVNVRLKDSAILVDAYGGWNSARERLIQKRDRFKKRCDRFAKQDAGKVWGPQYFDYNTGKFVNTFIYKLNIS